MTSEPYLARPGQSLPAHLDGVAEKAAMLAPDGATTAEGNSFSQLVETVAHLHDIGKLTPAFQQYIRELPDRSPNKSEYHAAPGAILTFHALAAQGFNPVHSMAGFYAVLRHHQGLPNIETEHTNWLDGPGKYTGLQSKLATIDNHARTAADKRLRTASNGELGWDDVHVDDPQWYKGAFPKLSSSRQLEGFYPLVQRIWSILTCADKLDAAGVPLSEIPPQIDPQQIDFENDATGIEYSLNEYRSRAQREVSAALASQAADSSDVFTLTLPTGFGKTFAGLKAALEHAERTDGRVIYALPYTTILDQVDDDIRTHLEVSPLTEAYTLHHHLADTRTKLGSNESGEGSVSDGTEALYAEAWQSRLVLTTFVQLFESLAGPANTQSMKLPALQDATIIVDEPQALPPTWWRLVTQLVNTLEEDYNATVILMTATQPRFIDRSSVPLDPDELVPDTDPYFEFLEANERVRFKIDASVPIGKDAPDPPLHPDEASRRLVDDAAAAGGATLAIANTVQSAAEISTAIHERAREQSQAVLNLGGILEEFVEENSDRLVSHLEDNAGVEALADDALETVRSQLDQQDPDLVTATLTAALRPSDRALLIELISALLEDGVVGEELPLLVTSTQLIEAGVDLSFDRIYRDFAPIPSLVQAAGRCNRSFGTERGEVVLWRLSSPAKDRLPCKQIYFQGGDRLSPTSAALRTVVSDDGTVPEATMITAAVDAYYDAFGEGDHRNHDRDELVDAYHRAKGETLREASLIEDLSEDVLVLVSDAERTVLKQYLAEKSAGNYRQGREALATLQQLFASVPEDRAAVLDESAEFCAKFRYEDASLGEFAVVDARGQAHYDLHLGSGLRQIE